MLSKFSLLAAVCALVACNGPTTDDLPAAPNAEPEETTSFNGVTLPLPLAKSTKAEITAADLAARIKPLSDDALEGRGPGTLTGELAADWIAAEMNRIGLVPGGTDGSWFQTVEMINQTVDLSASNLTFALPDQAAHKIASIDDAVFWTKHQDTSTISLNASDLVFVGYGSVAPEYDWDDYAGLDLAGKTVIMLVNDPGYATRDEALFKGRTMTYYGRWTYKFEEAARQGADAAIIIHETEPASYGWDVVSSSWSGAQSDLVRANGGSDRVALEGWVTRDLAEHLFQAAGLDLEALKKDAAKPGFQPVALEGVSVSGTIEQTVDRLESRNVIGIAQGQTAPDEYMLYTGHWDHLGKKTSSPDSDQIYNGAVDNATGVAALLEIAEAIVAKPRERSTMFLSVTLEESGLLGSAYFAESPTVPLNSIIAGINIDGALPIGRTREMRVVGFGSSELENYLSDALGTQGRVIEPETRPEAGIYYRSDHISFAKKGVPMLYADGGEDKIEGGVAAGQQAAQDYNEHRYHKPSDEYSDDWDLSGFQEDTQALFAVGERIVGSNDWPTWYEGAEFEAIRKADMATR